MLIFDVLLDYCLMKIVTLIVLSAHYVFLFHSFQSTWKIPLSQLHTVPLNNVLFLAHHCFPLCLFQKVKLNRRVEINPHYELWNVTTCSWGCPEFWWRGFSEAVPWGSQCQRKPGLFKPEESWVHELCCLQVYFFLHWESGAKHPLACWLWQFCLPENPCTTQEIKWIPKKVEQVPVAENLQEKTILTPSRADLGVDPPFSKVILGKPSSSVIIWNSATGWSYFVWEREFLLHGNSNSGNLNAATESHNLSCCCTSFEWKLSKPLAVWLSFIFTVDCEILTTSLTPELHLITSEILFMSPLSEYIKHLMSLPNIKGDIKGNSNMPT